MKKVLIAISALGLAGAFLGCESIPFWGGQVEVKILESGLYSGDSIEIPEISSECISGSNSKTRFQVSASQVPKKTNVSFGFTWQLVPNIKSEVPYIFRIFATLRGDPDRYLFQTNVRYREKLNGPVRSLVTLKDASDLDAENWILQIEIDGEVKAHRKFKIREGTNLTWRAEDEWEVAWAYRNFDLSSSLKIEKPMAAQKDRIEGDVLIEAIVDEHGDVVSTKVIEEKPTGWGFKEAAISAITNCKFPATTSSNAPVRQRVQIPIHFE